MSSASEDEALTSREMDVLQAVARGLTNRQIAEVVMVSTKTVEHMLSSEDPFRGIFPKIGVKNRAEGAAWVTSYRLLKDQSEDALKQIRQIRINGHALLAMEWAVARFQV
jgi:DNA-binding NarL/FixJ family response regulator